MVRYLPNRVLDWIWKPTGNKEYTLPDYKELKAAKQAFLLQVAPFWELSHSHGSVSLKSVCLYLSEEVFVMLPLVGEVRHSIRYGRISTSLF